MMMMMMMMMLVVLLCGAECSKLHQVSVLSPSVIPLAVSLRGVVRLPKPAEQIHNADLLRIIDLGFRVVVTVFHLWDMTEKNNQKKVCDLMWLSEEYSRTRLEVGTLKTQETTCTASVAPVRPEQHSWGEPQRSNGDFGSYGVLRNGRLQLCSPHRLDWPFALQRSQPLWNGRLHLEILVFVLKK